MKYWLFKTEPETFSVDDLARARGATTAWDGVRNYQVRNMLRDEMKAGDLGFLYHSSCDVPGIYGIAEVASTPYPDPTQFQKKSKYFDEKATPEQPRWFLVDVKFVRKLKAPVALDTIRQHAEALGEDFALIRKGTRLSVLPVSAAQWKILLSLE